MRAGRLSLVGCLSYAILEILFPALVLIDDDDSTLSMHIGKCCMNSIITVLIQVTLTQI